MMKLTKRQLRKLIIEAITVGEKLYKIQHHMFDYEPAPARGYVWINPEQIENERAAYVPFAGKPVEKYREFVRSNYKEDSFKSLGQMEKILFSSAASWGHNSLLKHPSLDKVMLPLDWSIMFDEWKKKVLKKIQTILHFMDSNEMTDEQEDKLTLWIQSHQEKIKT